MSLNYLSGIDQMELDYLGGRAERKAKRAARKQKRDEKKAAGGGFLKKVAKVGLAPSRAAFITAVRLNVMKLASRLAKLYKTNPKKFEDFWIKFGGKPSELKKIVEKGSKQSLGVIDPATQSAIAAALPIITVLLKTLKGEGITEGVSEDEDAASVDAMKDELSADTDVQKDVATMPEETEVAKVKAPVAEETSTETTTTGNKNLMLYAALGLGAVLILPKIMSKR